jgi:hypothetical protein
MQTIVNGVALSPAKSLVNLTTARWGNGSGLAAA